jgi:hypothetical protein
MFRYVKVTSDGVTIVDNKTYMFRYEGLNLLSSASHHTSSMDNYQSSLVFIISPLPAKAEGDYSFRSRPSVTLKF